MQQSRPTPYWAFPPLSAGPSSSRTLVNATLVRAPSYLCTTCEPLHEAAAQVPERRQSQYRARTPRITARPPARRKSVIYDRGRHRMPPNLCCTADEDARSSSPDLPNVRVSEATPAKRPLLHSRTGSQGSRFTSARSEDLHELRQIFNSAHDIESSSSPKKANRARFVRPSVYSLHTLHRIKSVQALLGRKRSRDLTKKPSDVASKGDGPKHDVSEESDTVVRTPKHGPNLEVHVTKSDLRRDLLSDKRPEDGGYDSDAEVLDDIARKVAKKSPSKRPSLHSIDWTPSPGSVRTPESTKRYRAATAGQHKGRHPPRHLGMRSFTPGTTRFSNVFSTPNLRIHTPKSKNRKLKRSHSATSVENETHPRLAPIRLPSIKADDGVAWADAMNESLRLTALPTFPLLSDAQTMRPLSVSKRGFGRGDRKSARLSAGSACSMGGLPPGLRSVSEPLKSQIHLEPSAECPSPVKHNVASGTTVDIHVPPHASKEEDPRSSVHLHNMHISHHLRSGSLLSWDKNAEALDLPAPPPVFRDRTVSEYSRSSRLGNRSRHGRQTSSSGFASARIPTKWGNVVAPSQQREEMSSVYSSRPHSPPDSFGGSMANLSLPTRQADLVIDIPRSRTSNHLKDIEKTPIPPQQYCNSFPAIAYGVDQNDSETHRSDGEETPKPPKRYGITNLQASENTSLEDPLLKGPKRPSVARHNSVANTKKSKFREEFSPTPPRKRSTPTISFMKILRHRNDVRSQSEANLKFAKANVDGPSDEAQSPTQRERAISVSLISMQKEQESMGKEKSANPVWQKALKSYQDEKSSLLLPGNKGFSEKGSPFRERSSSVSVRARSTHSLTPMASIMDVEPSTDAIRPHTPFEEPDDGPSFPPKLFKRRTALAHAEDVALDNADELRTAFDKQKDTIETVGAWGRYPSHTRHDRTGSAGHADSVTTRDFALEAAVQFAKGDDPDEGVDPTARPESPLSEGGRKRKKKLGKSSSMTFGKAFIKNYTKRFRSQSTEFHRHGYGHRSSIAAGGTLEHPELEMLPQVWSTPIAEDRERERSRAEASGSGSGQEDEPSPLPTTSFMVKGKQRAEDSMATLRPPKNGRDTALDGATDTDTSADRARVWSTYYGDCISAYPRASVDFASTSQPNLAECDKIVELEEFGAMPNTGRHSLESKRTSIKSMKSNTVPARYRRHSRHVSCLSKASVASRASILASFTSVGGSDGLDGGDGAEVRSVVSVRRSTLDLLNVYREQEIAERERVLGMMRGESVRCA